MAGVVQDSIWVWVDNPMKGAELQLALPGGTGTATGDGVQRTKTWPVVAAAFTASELGERLKPYSMPYWFKDQWCWDHVFGDKRAYGHSDTEANARAQKYLQLIQAGVVRP